MTDFPGEIKILPIDPVFSNGVNFIKNLSIIKQSGKSKRYKQSIFFPEIRKFVFFFCLLAFIEFFQLSIGHGTL